MVTRDKNAAKKGVLATLPKCILYPDCQKYSVHIIYAIISLSAYAWDVLWDIFQHPLSFNNSWLVGLLFTVKLKPGQLRLGEHTDYRTTTLLYNTGPGLQVRKCLTDDFNKFYPWLGTINLTEISISCSIPTISMSLSQLSVTDVSWATG